MTTYLNKGVEKFFIRQGVQEHYLRYCDTLATAILNNARVPDEIKVTQVGNWGEETAKFLRSGGMNEGAVNYARRYAKTVQSLVRQLGLDKSDIIRRFLQGNATLEHSVGVMMIASLLSIPLKLDSERSASIVGLSALLHDVGLSALGKKFLAEDTSRLTPEELKLFHTHPAVGQQILAEAVHVEPVVLQAVVQHHERRNGKGFPHRLGSGSINLVAEILGLSEEIQRQIERAARTPRLDFLTELEKSCVDAFSASTFATVKIFFR